MIYLRKMRETDAELLFKMDNDPAVLRAAGRDKPRDFDEYRKDLIANRIGDPDHKGFIADLGIEPVGNVGFRLRADGKKEIYCVIVPKWRGRGFARRIIELGLARTHGCVVAHIHQWNHASIALVESVGFKKTRQTDGGRIVWQRDCI